MMDDNVSLLLLGIAALFSTLVAILCLYFNRRALAICAGFFILLIGTILVTWFQLEEDYVLPLVVGGFILVVIPVSADRLLTLINRRFK